MNDELFQSYEEALELSQGEIELLEKQLADARATIAMLEWQLSMNAGIPNKDFLDTIRA